MTSDVLPLKRTWYLSYHMNITLCCSFNKHSECESQKPTHVLSSLCLNTFMFHSWTVCVCIIIVLEFDHYSRRYNVCVIFLKVRLKLHLYYSIFFLFYCWMSSLLQKSLWCSHCYIPWNVHLKYVIQVSQWVLWPLFLSPSPLLFSPCVCACSSQCVRRCCGSSRASSCVETACRWGVDGQLRCSDRGPCPWRSAGRERPPSASATANCAGAPGSLNLSPTDWHRRPLWLQEDAVTSAFAPNADVSRDWGCVLPGPQEPFHLLRTVMRA